MTGSTQSQQLRLECEQFLIHEAELLDDKKLHEWLSLLAEDIDYRVPRRVTRERGADASEFSDTGFLYRDDYGTLETRVERYDREYAWAENPPTRTRRVLGNVRAEPADGDELASDDPTTGDELAVKSNLLLYRNEKDDTDHDVIACERQDTLRRTGDGFELASRTVLLDQTVLATKNLSFFL